MSFPNIPDMAPNFQISRENVINILLASIAFEELGLAHVINAEAEKIQFVIGTLGTLQPYEPPTIEQLVEINKAVERTLRNVAKNQMLLQFKLEDILALIKTPVSPVSLHKNIATVSGTYNSVVYTDTDYAYYHSDNISA